MFAIEIDLLRGVFDAGGRHDEDSPEWPPHPVRLLNGLLASADIDDARELDALQWLERQPPPTIVASVDVVECGGRSSYVPTNRREKNTDVYGRFPGRKALGPRTWRAVSPKDPVVRYEWPDSAPSDIADVLNEIAGRLPYLGRSTSPVVASVAAGENPDGATSSRWTPLDAGEIGTDLQLPSSGYIDGLIDAFEGDRQPWSVPRATVAYGIDRAMSPSPVGAASGPYGEMIVLGFADGRRLGVGHALLIASRLREAIESHIDGGPVVLRGLPPQHQRTIEEAAVRAPRHQVMIAGLPFVGSEHADGQLRGVAVMLPRDIDRDDRQNVLKGLVRTVENGLALGRLGRVGLDPSVQSIRTLQVDRWTRPSRRWISATPMSANRHHRKPDHEWMRAQVVESCAHLDLPVPTSVQVAPGPLIAGAERLSARQRLRHPGKRNERVTASFHVSIEFGVDVAGPIVLGSLRRYGLGLMLPRNDRTAASGTSGETGSDAEDEDAERSEGESTAEDRTDSVTGTVAP